MSVVLKAEKREKLGTLSAKKIRKEGLIPAVIYSKEGNINLSLDGKEFEHEYFKGISLTSVFELELGGKKVKAITHKIELDPVSDRPVHVDFFLCEDKKALRAKPKLVFVGQDKSPGLKKGGTLHIVLRRAEVVCDNANVIPQTIEVDTSALHVGFKLRANDLKLPQGVTFLKKDNFLICSIIGRGKSEEDKTAAAAPAAGAAAPAAAAKAPAKAEDKK